MTQAVEAKKHSFMLEQVYMLSWNASVQRVSLYRSGASDGAKAEFRRRVFNLLESDIVPSYSSPCPEDVHLKNIERLMETGSSDGSSILLDDGYRYGVAQKLLNLYLKYRWCMGQVAEPPHCPVDRIVLEKTTLRDKFNWTRMTTEEQYMSAINALRQVAAAQGQSLAVWELLNYGPNKK